MGWLSGARQESYARRDLAALAERLSASGLSTEAPQARLGASVDQHAAAVRDILGFGGGRIGVVELAAYAQGVLDAAAEAGWTPEHEAGPADWECLRLRAVCALADGCGTVSLEELDPAL